MQANFPHFDDPDLARQLLERIKTDAAGLGQIAKLMEVCGTHTMEIGRLGLRALLPSNIELVSGPGCPVCVTPGSYIDAAVACAQKNDCIITTYGDMVRVPGDITSLEAARGQGLTVQVVASPLEALETARISGRPIMFLAVGFETTTPATAVAITSAARLKLPNISFLVSHKIIPPAMAILAQDKDLAVSGFLLPGHVSAILGADAYRFMAGYKQPGVITGFDPLDILAGIAEAMSMLSRNEAGVRNAYPRVVTGEGNVRARAAVDTVFETCDDDWRGLVECR